MRCCEPTYSTESLTEEGIDVMVGTHTHTRWGIILKHSIVVNIIEMIIIIPVSFCLASVLLSDYLVSYYLPFLISSVGRREPSGYSVHTVLSSDGMGTVASHVSLTHKNVTPNFIAFKKTTVLIKLWALLFSAH